MVIYWDQTPRWCSSVIPSHVLAERLEQWQDLVELQILILLTLRTRASCQLMRLLID